MTKTTQRLAAVYARVSTEEQLQGQVASLDTQVIRCREKAAGLGIPIGEHLIVQEQHSGADLRWEGTQFMALARRAENHEFTDLICLNVDRFSRGGAEVYIEQRGLFTKAGVTIHYVLSDFGNGPFSRSMEAISADAAQWQRDILREASVRNRTEWARQGNIVRGNTPPFGFQFVYDETRRTRRNFPVVVKLIPDPATAPLVLQMTEHIANGGTLRSLRDWLNAQKIPTAHGGTMWYDATVRQILLNPTNYGARRSHYLRTEERPGGSRRAAAMKTKHRQVPVPEAEQYIVDPERIEPIPGLTEDLWRRVALRLVDNKAFSSRRAKRSEAERAERALLFGGPARCAVCGGSLSIKRNSNVTHKPWMYTCNHLDTVYYRQPTVSMMAHKLDGAVWGMAVTAMRDPAFLAELLAKTDATIGPAVRAESLQQQLAEAQAAHERLLRQLERLDADDELVVDYQGKLRKNNALQATLTEALAAAQKAVQAEVTRRTTLAAFRNYAAQEAAALDEKTPLERRRILLALRTRVRLHSGERPDRLRIVFDIRGLPGAGTALVAGTTEQPAHWIDFDTETLPTVEWLQTPGAVGFQPDGTPEEAPCPPSEKPAIDYQWHL